MCAAVIEERRWAGTYPWLGEDPVPTEPCISEDVYRREVEKVFKKVWLHTYPPPTNVISSAPRMDGRSSI